MCNDKCGTDEELKLDYKGDLFAYKIRTYEDGRKSVEIFLEDDEYWHYETSFHPAWIEDFKNMVLDLEKHKTDVYGNLLTT